ncbi:hypothetical protein ACVGXO_11285, partial [Enterobacter hormaechei]
ALAGGVRFALYPPSKKKKRTPTPANAPAAPGQKNHPPTVTAHFHANFPPVGFRVILLGLQGGWRGKEHKFFSFLKN